MKKLFGTIVAYHMNLENQVRAGGSHTPARLFGNQHAPAIIVRDNKDGTVNLKVFCDSRDDIWVINVTKGTGPNQWEPLEENELKDNTIDKVGEEAPEAEVTTLKLTK